MNRTQRAIKRQLRQKEADNRNWKNRQIEKRKQSRPGGAYDRKQTANHNVFAFHHAEKEARKKVVEYKEMCCAKSNMEVAEG